MEYCLNLDSRKSSYPMHTGQLFNVPRTMHFTPRTVHVVQAIQKLSGVQCLNTRCTNASRPTTILVVIFYKLKTHLLFEHLL